MKDFKHQIQFLLFGSVFISTQIEWPSLYNYKHFIHDWINKRYVIVRIEHVIFFLKVTTDWFYIYIKNYVFNYEHVVQ